jgi:hypothetical protein
MITFFQISPRRVNLRRVADEFEEEMLVQYDCKFLRPHGSALFYWTTMFFRNQIVPQNVEVD